MRPAARRRYWIEQRQFANLQESIWAPVFRRAIEAQIRPAVNFLKDQGYQMTIPQLQILVPEQPIRIALTRMYRDVFVRMANISAKRIQDTVGKELRQEKAYGTPNAYWLQLITEYMMTEGATKVTMITDTTRDFIRRKMVEGYEQNLAIDEMVQILLRNEINANRARLIARTENTNITSLATQASARRSGILMQKVWISAQDNRTRRTPPDKFDHLDMDNKTAMMDEPFNVSGEFMQHPGDPAGSAGNVCNCRCTVAHEAVRDENGRLIRTPVPQVSRIFVERPRPSNITQIITI